MLDHILVPLDGSELSERALNLGKDLARATGARMSIVTVVLRYGESVPGQLKLEAESRKQIGDYLNPIRDQLTAEGLQAVSSVEFGNPADAIAEFAKREGVDLIIMSTHGVGSGAKYALGSTALKVLQIAHCPVTMLQISEAASVSKYTAQERLGDYLSVTGTA